MEACGRGRVESTCCSPWPRWPRWEARLLLAHSLAISCSLVKMLLYVDVDIIDLIAMAERGPNGTK